MNKKKKAIIIINILIFIFSILKISSSLAATESFVITNIQISQKSDTAEVNNIKHEKNKVENEIIFHSLGDSVTYEITLKNNENKKYKLKSISDDNENEYITYEYNDYKNLEFDSKKENEIFITAKYSKKVDDISKRTQDIPVKFTLIFEDEEENVKKENIEIAPLTGDGIEIYFITAGISVLIVVFVLKYNSLNCYSKGKHSKSSIKFFTILLTAVIIIPTLAKAMSISTNISFVNDIKFYDSLIVTFNVDGEEEQKIVKYKEKITGIQNPEKPGYKFNGWYTKADGGEKITDGKAITEDTVYYAQFELMKYPISYELDGGTASNPDKYTMEDEITLNNPTKQGYTFIGWTGSNGDTPQTEVKINQGTTGSKEYTANFEINTYTVTFDSKGGNSIASVTKEYNEKIGTLPEPTKENKIFEGWYADEEYNTKIEETTKIIEDVTYYAKWRDYNNCTVTFDAQGGNIDNDSKVVREGESLGTFPIPTKENYKFAGWYTTISYDEKVTESTIINDNVTYYAKWKDRMEIVFLNENSVTFNGKNIPIADGEVQDEYLGTDGKYIETHVSLFSEENFDKDFEIGFTIESYDPNDQDSKDQLVFVNTKDEIGVDSIRPGIVFRVIKNVKNQFELKGAASANKGVNFTDYSVINSVKIYRENKKIYYSINNGEKKALNLDYTGYTNRFDTTATFGAAVQQNGTVYRHIRATLSNMYIKLETDDEY